MFEKTEITVTPKTQILIAAILTATSFSMATLYMQANTSNLQQETQKIAANNTYKTFNDTLTQIDNNNTQAAEQLLQASSRQLWILSQTNKPEYEQIYKLVISNCWLNKLGPQCPDTINATMQTLQNDYNLQQQQKGSPA